jgi:hypothetical protein
MNSDVGDTPVAFDERNNLCLVLTAFWTIKEEKIIREIRIMNEGLTLTFLLSFDDKGMIILFYMREDKEIKRNSNLKMQISKSKMII